MARVDARTLCSLMFLGSSLCLTHCVIQLHVDVIGADLQCDRALYDVVHASVPMMFVDDFVIDVALTFPVLLAGWCIRGHRAHLCDVAMKLGVLYYLRCVTMAVTVLPSPICTRHVRSMSLTGGCHDCIFSGHASMILVCCHIIARYRPEHTLWLWCYALCSSITIVACRSHYTVDVIVAWIVVYAIFCK